MLGPTLGGDESTVDRAQDEPAWLGAGDDQRAGVAACRETSLGLDTEASTLA
jgi:hypothetical protein